MFSSKQAHLALAWLALTLTLAQLSSADQLACPKRPGLLEKLICPAQMLADEQLPSSFDPIFFMQRQGVRYALGLNSTRDQILAAGFGPDKHTTVLVHGWAQDSSDPWLELSFQMMEANALEQTDNLIVVDWGAASKTGYREAVARMRPVALRLARFLRKLIEELGSKPELFHLVGHSLGSHLVAVAGKQFREAKLGRVSSLDSAGPCFKRMPAQDAEMRLSADCANEVIVYHYDDASYGLSGQHGHLDIYVNGGRDQPGCQVDLAKAFELASSMITKKKVTISHTRSTDLAMVNLAASQCQQVAYECQDYDHFLQGECGQCDEQNNQCFLMGFAIQHGRLAALERRGILERPGNKQLYIRYQSPAPFCDLHYQIRVRFEPSPALDELFARRQWQLYLTLVTEQGEIHRLQLKHRQHRNLFTHLLLYDGSSELSKLTSGRLEMRNGQGQLPDSLRASYIEINFMSNIDPQVRAQLSTKLCPTHKEANFKQSGLGDNLIVFLTCSLLPDAVEQ